MHPNNRTDEKEKKSKKQKIKKAALFCICIISVSAILFAATGQTDYSLGVMPQLKMNENYDLEDIEAALGIETPAKKQEANNLVSVPAAAETEAETDTAFSIDNIPVYSENPYTVVNNNIPYFEISELSTSSFETYSPLDSLGRCGTAYACIGQDIMPTAERGEIGQIKPAGWHTVKYDNVDGKYLYNRCHLIGYQLSGENANEQNLITGTRYLNTEGMLPFENMVADYVKETGNHVMYRVTPVYNGDNLLAAGVLMEGYSVEDNGGGICYNVFCYNVQPGISINYENGDSSYMPETAETKTPETAETKTPETAESEMPKTAVPEQNTDTNITYDQENTSDNVKAGSNVINNEYIVNKNSKKFHKPTCSSEKTMKDSNKLQLNCTREEAVSLGYTPCQRCNP